MFAPRPEFAVAEMRRVLKPSGRIAFATWPPENLVGQCFQFIGRHAPPPPPGVPPPSHWGDAAVIKERLARRFDECSFERGVMTVPALSLAHYRSFMERSVGPMQKLVESLSESPEHLNDVRREFEAICEPYYAGKFGETGVPADARRSTMKRAAVVIATLLLAAAVTPAPPSLQNLIRERRPLRVRDLSGEPVVRSLLRNVSRRKRHLHGGGASRTGSRSIIRSRSARRTRFGCRRPNSAF